MSAPAFGNPGADSGSTSSSLSGTAHEVVQARDISGGVHFHVPPRPETPVPRQLPADAHGFVGRVAELERLESFVAGPRPPGPRVAVVMGTAGAGKTSFVVRFAHQASVGFPDGQLFVDLHGYAPGPPASPGAVLDRFLRALGTSASDVPGEPEEREELYRSLTADRRLLVVLDNAATVGQVRPLIPGGAESLVLVTSRGRLPGLSARVGAHRLTLGLLSDQEAVALLRTATDGYRAGDAPEQVAELAALCARLPLALRIAAERAAARPLMPLQDLIADLRGESSLWDALSSEDDMEADAVRTVFAWSYRALPAAAARAFRLLGMHPGPDFGPGAAAAIMAESAQQVRGLLDLLAGAHLLEQIGPERYHFHDLLRAYASGLAVQDETSEANNAAVSRLAQWYLHTADNAVRETQSLFPSILDEHDPVVTPLRFSGYAAAMEWYIAEEVNLLAIARTAANSGFDEISWRLPVTLETLLSAHADIDAWIEIAELGLAAARRLGDRSAEAAVRLTLGAAHRMARAYDHAAEHYRGALDLYTELGHRTGMLQATNRLGVAHLLRRELVQALGCFNQTLALAETAGLASWRAIALDNLAWAYSEMGFAEQAIEHGGEALRLQEELGSEPRLRLQTLIHLTRACQDAGDLEQGEVHVAASAEIIAGSTTYRPMECEALLARADLRQAQGRHDQALEDLWHCLSVQRSIGDGNEAPAFDGIGRALLAMGNVGEALAFHQRAVALHRSHSDSFTLALALSHLADALDENGEQPAADDARAEAYALVQAFDDPRANELRSQLRAARR